jgi:homoserine dehydrogenase
MSALGDAETVVEAHPVRECSLPTLEQKPSRTGCAPTSAIAIVLLGTGVVGGAFLKLLNTPASSALRLVGAANSRRQQTDPDSLASRSLREQLNSRGDARDNASLLASKAAAKVIIDATASTSLAARHAEWLGHGYHVVTANKALAGGALSGWRALQAATAQGATYGDAATVGAGLPVLSTLRRLRLCGDALLTLEGVFSGSLSWLFNQYDGKQPFSALLREARKLGYTEPDPRSDLSGEDVAMPAWAWSKCRTRIRRQGSTAPTTSLP